MFFRYFVAGGPKQLGVVLLHIDADVCPLPFMMTSLVDRSGRSEANDLLQLVYVTCRDRSLGFAALPPVTTSTRIPLLSQ
jgi:hypothetical protein